MLPQRGAPLPEGRQDRRQQHAATGRVTDPSPDGPHAAGPRRLVALDGLRGIAALVVVIHHIYQISQPSLHTHTFVWWLLSETPLKLFTAGSQAVLVFFVLSGLVVPLPALRGGPFSWTGFLTSRMFRLYLPVWASLALASLSIEVVHRTSSHVADGAWVTRANATAFSWRSLYDEATLTQAVYRINSVLWSLRWELIFSVLLPLFVALALVVRRYWAPAVAVCFTVTVAGKVEGVDWWQYLPVFFIGTLMAVNLDAIRTWSARCGRWRHGTALWWCVLTASALSIVTSWMLRPVIPAGSWVSDSFGSLTPVGAAGLVLCGIGFPAVERGLSARVPQWLGRISFSLYLVHLPLLVTLTFALGDARWWLVGLIGVPLAVAAGTCYFRLIESPSHRFAKRAGHYIQSLTHDPRTAL